MYVHLPFCRRKCAYCDFVSYSGKEDSISSYISQVLLEWQAISTVLLASTSFRITSCYLGGGTPSLLSEEQVRNLVEGLFPQGVPADMEFSIEANPESLTVSKLACYRDLGINRISLGVQSFNDTMLLRLGRIHTTRQAVEAITSIQDSGWENYSIDLMYGLPGQSMADFSADLKKALWFGTPHLSMYCLTINPSTPFGRQLAEGKLMLPREEEIIKMMDVLEEETLSVGFEHYETSNFAKPGFACRHNLTYWQLDPYIGLGVGAVSFFTQESGPWGAHWENPSTFWGYERIARSGKWPFLERAPLPRESAFMETLLTGLRLREGIEINQLQSRFGKEMVKKTLQGVAPIVREGWLEVEKGHLRATKQGGRILDALILELVSDIMG